MAVFVAVEAASAAFPGDAGRGDFHLLRSLGVGSRRREEYLGQSLDDISPIFRRNDIDEVPPSRGEIQIGTRRRHGERVRCKFGGIPLKEIIDVYSATQKDAA